MDSLTPSQVLKPPSIKQNHKDMDKSTVTTSTSSMEQKTTKKQNVLQQVQQSIKRAVNKQHDNALITFKTHEKTVSGTTIFLFSNSVISRSFLNVYRYNPSFLFTLHVPFPSIFFQHNILVFPLFFFSTTHRCSVNPMNLQLLCFTNHRS